MKMTWGDGDVPTDRLLQMVDHLKAYRILLA